MLNLIKLISIDPEVYTSGCSVLECQMKMKLIDQAWPIAAQGRICIDVYKKQAATCPRSPQSCNNQPFKPEAKAVDQEPAAAMATSSTIRGALSTTAALHSDSDFVEYLAGVFEYRAPGAW